MRHSPPSQREHTRPGCLEDTFASILHHPFRLAAVLLPSRRGRQIGLPMPRTFPPGNLSASLSLSLSLFSSVSMCLLMSCPLPNRSSACSPLFSHSFWVCLYVERSLSFVRQSLNEAAKRRGLHLFHSLHLPLAFYKFTGQRVICQTHPLYAN
ncbi:unnamed protein product [Protopolystoma xenopodis]|uniref:Uncharacterized protein n=1 Tax=Protopolystoma xenopodis TaxID=117903 RepID=A0A448WPU1_9PLAT|nr:unnamed protein product [Protopolystoma xenopodis]